MKRIDKFSQPIKRCLSNTHVLTYNRDMINSYSVHSVKNNYQT